MGHVNSSREILTRRDALKTLAAITGAATLAALPGRWETPIVEIGALPAHAACSFVPGTATLELINQTGRTLEVFVNTSGEELVCSATLAPGESLCCTELAGGEYFYDGFTSNEDCFVFGTISLAVDQVTSVNAVCEVNGN